jgi:hypothetical protein
MYYDHPSNPEAYRNKNQYLFGSELVVSPITTRKVYSTDMASTETWLPAGRYVDLFTGMVYDGDRVIKTHRSTDKTPVLARGGSIIPLDNSSVKGEVKNGAPIPDAIEIIVVVGKDGSLELLEDDGRAEEIESIKFAKTPVVFSQEKGQITIGPTENPLVKERKWSIRLPAFSAASLEAIKSKTKIQVKKDDGAVIIQITAPVSASDKIVIDLGTKPELDKNDIQSRALQILDKSQIDHDLKWGVWQHFQEMKGMSSNVFMSRLRAFGMEEEVMDALLEVLLAQD